MADLSSRKVRKSNFSPEEVEALVNTVSKHYNILYGEFAKRAVNKHARHRVWLDVTKHVNRVSIERRTLQEVKNKWKKCQHLYRDPDKLEFPEDFVVPNVWEPLAAIKDSMPLEQRITKTPGDQEPVLHSQPLSPTKLKVTRQAAKPPQPSPKPPTPEPPNEEVCLRWNSHHSNMQSTFPNLLLREQYVDATLVAEGQTLKCHRLILSSCSPYFEEVLSGISPFQHPVLFMKDIPFWILKSLCDFMYAGEVHIYQNKLEELLAVAETLKIKGLAGKTEGAGDETKPSEPPKEEKKDEREIKDRKKHSQSQPMQQTDLTAPKPNPKLLRSSHTSKKAAEKVQKDIVKGDDILDPLDLLEPVYEELTKESNQTIVPVKYRESKNVPIKKGLPKKVKKRKLSEEREESPPPLFLSRKGTRSRPNVKIPKYYHTHYDRHGKNVDFPESTIVREPHTDQTDPLLEVEEIKAEPLDFQDDVIEIEDNVVSFSDQEMPSLHEEEIIGNYDSPIVNINDNSMDGGKDEDRTGFKKISLLPQPIIMDVHSVSEKSPNTLKIVDVAQLTGPLETLVNRCEDPLEAEMATAGAAESSKDPDDPLNLIVEPAKKNTGDITITNVESMADVEMKDTEEKIDNNQEPIFHIVEVASEHEVKKVDEDADREGVSELEAATTEDVGQNSHMEMESKNENKEDDSATDFRIEKVVSELEETAGVDTCPNLHITTVVDVDDEVEEGCATGDDSDLHIGKVASEQREIKEGNGDVDPCGSFNVDKATNEKECEDTEESTTLGFHIARVASEQFAINEAGRNRKDDGIDVISEDCVSELGFQITNVVSGNFENLEDKAENNPHKDSNNSELETIVNDLSGIVEESCGKKENAQQPGPDLSANINSTFSEETRCIAESLEDLLEK